MNLRLNPDASFGLRVEWSLKDLYNMLHIALLQIDNRSLTNMAVQERLRLQYGTDTNVRKRQAPFTHHRSHG